jgi:hypothetical protein
LDKALENRDAQYAILVAEYSESLPKSVGYFQENGQNKLIVALGSNESESFFPELLAAALQLARYRVAQSNQPTNQVDANRILSVVEELNDKLKRFALIKTECSNIEKSSKSIRTITDEIKTTLAHKVDELQNIIAVKQTA